MWLSIIIPLYNCENYVADCLSSLWRQGLNDDEFEVIVINDGSTDNSVSVADRFKTHPNFQIFSQPNQGVGEARNRGLRLAKGDFVMFIDADDWLLDGGIGALKRYIDFNAPKDMYTFWAHTVDRYYDESKWGHLGESKVLYEGTFKGYAENFGFGCTVWSRIISRKLLLNNKIIFTNHRLGEDYLYLARLFELTDATVTATSVNFYRYVVRYDSAINACNTEHNKRACIDFVNVCIILKELSTHALYPQKVYDQSLYECQTKCYIRMISGAKTPKALNMLRKEVLRSGVLPIRSNLSKLSRLINFSILHISILYIISLTYRRIFLPYIKPRINRN